MGRTTIIIAHRLSTIKKADVIVVLKEGNIVEMGTRRELLDLKGIFYKLVVAQVHLRSCTCVRMLIQYVHSANVDRRKQCLSGREIAT